MLGPDGEDHGYVVVEPQDDGGLYLEVLGESEGGEEVELRYMLPPDQVAQLREFLPSQEAC